MPPGGNPGGGPEGKASGRGGGSIVLCGSTMAAAMPAAAEVPLNCRWRKNCRVSAFLQWWTRSSWLDAMQVGVQGKKRARPASGRQWL